MEAVKKLLYWITGFLPVKIIDDHGIPYLERYYLWTVFGTRMYLHRFIGSDPDRGLHNHPWRWAISIVLSGFYWEKTHYGVKKVRWLNGLVGDTFHRVILAPEYRTIRVKSPIGIAIGLEHTGRLLSCWTLFMHRAKRAKSWGFLRDKGQLGIVFNEHTPSSQGDPEDWWTTAPTGRQLRAAPFIVGVDLAKPGTEQTVVAKWERRPAAPRALHEYEREVL
jgi:hypothetical protein